MYAVEIKESSKELTRIERVRMKDTGNAKKLDQLVSTDETFVIVPAGYVILSVHNDKSEDKDYDQYVVYDIDGNKFITGSDSFFSSFMRVWDELNDEIGEWSLEIYKRPSKNYSGKEFLSCSVV